MSTFPEFHDSDPMVAGAADDTVLAGHEAFDDHHQKIGTVTDVIYDEEGHPRWAVVDPGLLHRERYVPVEGTFLTESGDVVVPYSKDMVKSARAAGRDHILDPVLERALEDHYALPHSR